MIHLTTESANIIADTLENPPPITDAFRKAADAYIRGDVIKVFNDRYKKAQQVGKGV